MQGLLILLLKIKQLKMSVSSSFGNDLTTEILSELVLSGSPVLNEIDLHDKTHKLGLIKRIIFSFICIKGKHLSRSFNKEGNSMIRHSNTKRIIFSHE